MNRRFASDNRRAGSWPTSQAHPAGIPPLRWYVPRALGERGKSARPSRQRGARARIATALALFGALATLGACGGGPERQDADEPSGEFPVEITSAKFPTRQRLAERSNLELAVENIGEEQIPDLAVTICLDACNADGSFSLRQEEAGLANPNRPVWILEEEYPRLREPGMSDKELENAPSAGAEAAQTNTFSFGPLAPGDERNMVWAVTPVQGGTYTVNYELAAGLTGKAKAVTADGSPAKGSFVVTISTKAPRATVTPSGKVEIKE
jgi:hypothetical protein